MQYGTVCLHNRFPFRWRAAGGKVERDEAVGVEATREEASAHVAGIRIRTGETRQVVAGSEVVRDTEEAKPSVEAMAADQTG